MEHIIFLESAAQSIALRDENIPPPVSINVEDLMEPQILSQRKRQAEEYLIDVKYKNSRFIRASLDDVCIDLMDSVMTSNREDIPSFCNAGTAALTFIIVIATLVPNKCCSASDTVSTKYLRWRNTYSEPR